MTIDAQLDEHLQAIIDHGPPEQAAWAHQQLAARAALPGWIDEHVEKREWADALMLVPSEGRAELLVRILDLVDDPAEANQLLAGHFNVCDAFRGQVDNLRRHFERAGYVTDEPETTIELPVTVYRGQWGKDEVPIRQLSWSRDREIAERFARGLTGMRSKLVLGTYREDDEPWIWQAEATAIFGYLNSRGEDEVIVKALDIQTLIPIAKLVTVPE